MLCPHPPHTQTPLGTNPSQYNGELFYEIAERNEKRKEERRAARRAHKVRTTPKAGARTATAKEE